MTGIKPNPGSKEAIELGCNCPCWDNNYGKGVPYHGSDGVEHTAFWYNKDCPVHCSKNNVCTNRGDNDALEIGCSETLGEQPDG